MPYWWKYKLVQPLWKTVWRFLKKLRIELPYTPGIPFWAFIQTKNPHKSKRYMHPFVHCSIIYNSKTWKQLKCLSIDGCVKKMWHMDNGILLSHKKNEILSFAATWMDLDGIMLREIRQRKTNAILYGFMYVWNLKNKRNNQNKIETEIYRGSNLIFIGREKD